MADLSEHFSEDEFKCKCGCGLYLPNSPLVCVLQTMRYRLGHRLIISSGTRCATHNEAVGGEVGSAHLIGEAADIACDNIWTRSIVVRIALGSGINRIGISSKYIHIDLLRSAPQHVIWVKEAAQDGA